MDNDSQKQEVECVPKNQRQQILLSWDLGLFLCGFFFRSASPPLPIPAAPLQELNIFDTA